MASTNGLQKIPSEIRREIFTLALPDEWRGTMPAIILALRTNRDQRIYVEVLAAFHARNYTYALTIGNNYGFKDMPSTMISTIGKVRIIIDDDLFPSLYESTKRPSQQTTRTPAGPRKPHLKGNILHLHAAILLKKPPPFLSSVIALRHSLTLLRNVRAVTLHYPYANLAGMVARVNFNLLVGFRNLTHVSLHCVETVSFRHSFLLRSLIWPVSEDVSPSGTMGGSLQTFGDVMLGAKGLVAESPFTVFPGEGCVDCRGETCTCPCHDVSYVREIVWTAKEGTFLKQVEDRVEGGGWKGLRNNMNAKLGDNMGLWGIRG